MTLGDPLMGTIPEPGDPATVFVCQPVDEIGPHKCGSVNLNEVIRVEAYQDRVHGCMKHPAFAFRMNAHIVPFGRDLIDYRGIDALYAVLASNPDRLLATICPNEALAYEINFIALDEASH